MKKEIKSIDQISMQSLIGIPFINHIRRFRMKKILISFFIVFITSNNLFSQQIITRIDPNFIKTENVFEIQSPGITVLTYNAQINEIAGDVLLKSVRESDQEEQTIAAEVAQKFADNPPEKMAQAFSRSAAVAVVDDRNILWKEVQGHVNGKDTSPIDENTIFSIQSMSKSFTALAVLMAVQDGLVDLDTPIKEYLPDFTVNSIYDEHPEEIITLRHLLSHRAGFTHEAPYGSNFDDRNDFEKHIKSITTTWLRYPVGYCWSYANCGIDLVGYILQVRSGKPFELYVKEKVLDPIGMTSSTLDMDVIERNINRAIGYYDDNDNIPVRIPMIPSGGVYTNILDMAKYVQFHINKGVVDGRRILRKDLIDEMHSVQYAKSKQRSGYCLGLIREPVCDSYNVYHSGGGYGFRAEMIMYPEMKLGIVLLTNNGEFNMQGWEIRDYIQPLLDKRFGNTPIEEPGTERMNKLENEDPKVQRVMGSYAAGMIIKYEQEVLGLQYGGRGFYPIKFYDDGGELVGMFRRYSEIRFLPLINDRPGSLVLVNRTIGGAMSANDFHETLNEPPGPNKPQWAEYLGEYEMINKGVPDDIVTAIIKNGYLYFDDDKCIEYKPGLFFTFTGQALDFRSNQATYANIPIRKKNRHP